MTYRIGDRVTYTGERGIVAVATVVSVGRLGLVTIATDERIGGTRRRLTRSERLRMAVEEAV